MELGCALQIHRAVRPESCIKFAHEFKIFDFSNNVFFK